MFLLTPQDGQLRFTLGEGEPSGRSGALDIGDCLSYCSAPGYYACTSYQVFPGLCLMSIAP